MFHFYKDEAATSIEWNPKQVQYIEAWSFPNVNEVISWNFRQGLLDNSQIEAWLQQTGSFSIPDFPPSVGHSNGGVRLLICDYTSFPHPLLGMSFENYCLVESTLGLHPATLPALQVHAGTFSGHFKSSQEKDKISIVLKAPQKYEIANYMLSLTHDPTSRWTTALLAGEAIIEPPHLFGEYPSDIPIRFRAPAGVIRASLMQSPEAWNNPLTLPCILVTDHLKRLQNYSTGSLTQEVMIIEEQLGVTRVGRRNQMPRFDGQAGRKSQPGDTDGLNFGIPERYQAKFLTIAINTRLTSILFTRRSPKWNYEASEFLMRLISEFSEVFQEQQSLNDRMGELMEHNISLAHSIEDQVLNLQARLELQLNVLYSFVAQSDNQLNARLAATTGRDSTSMKILAFITTIFLPGTFIATLFSMDMFDWKNDASDPSLTVSSQFWIYWAAALPLTALTLGGWALWWNFEKHRYDVHKAAAPKRADRPSKSSWWRKSANV
ncbi:uncharacterized protein BDW43DRAFT_307421 [Aspergillus alliaceus]|uniref:uncharacterized protein n=1 Tax=Petromyces alliaceus TaxID=209559 RepID=UPI0012A41AE9|nr:uncharacterized protein BDW43DRAFT_307421 [Aspergillus alliaceus]KAB8237140.1 hypothetical protein BDW43DRAFT_307421 [Aspergillus alliaceus]